MVWAAVLERRSCLLRHDRFVDAVRQHTDGVLRVRESIRDASKMLAKEERYRAFTIFTAMAAEALLESGGEGAVPFRVFYETCTARARLSDRSAKTVAALLVHYRFANARDDPGDRRRKLLVPTARMTDYILSWSIPAYEALDTLDRPGGVGTLEEQVLRTFASARDSYAKAGPAFFGDNPDFTRVFGLMEGGSVVCMSALSASFAARPGPTRTEIATRFALSRAQVSQVIAEGRAAGLFTASAAVEPSPALTTIYLECEATVLAFIDIHRERATRQVVAAPARPAQRAVAGRR